MELEKLLGVKGCPNCLFNYSEAAWEDCWEHPDRPMSARTKVEMFQVTNLARDDLATGVRGIGDVQRALSELGLTIAHLYEACPLFELPWFQLDMMVPERLHESELGLVRWCFNLVGEYLREVCEYTESDVAELSGRVSEFLRELRQPVVTRIFAKKHGSITGHQYRYVNSKYLLCISVF